MPQTRRVAEQRAWLRRFIAVPQRSERVFAEGLRLGYGRGPVRRAGAYLGVIAYRVGGFADTGCWYWKLPNGR